MSANRIRLPDGSAFHGRGANLHDTRSCDACTWNAPNVDEVLRRMDALVDGWGANFFRLLVEAYPAASGRVHWQSPLQDAAYVADLKRIVAHAAAKPGVYVLLSVWDDPSFSPEGWPTATTQDVWAVLADAFKDEPRVMFGLVNEPENNFSGAQDATVWAAMNATVQRIRDVETAAGTPQHVILAQGTGGWSRRLGYYVTHPITAGGGTNVAYEIHVYDGQSQFKSMFEDYSAQIPIVIGEFGPATGFMSEGDCTALMDSAEAREIPYLAWTFHMRCPPNLLVDGSGGACGVNMPLVPTSWGTLLKNRLARPW